MIVAVPLGIDLLAAAATAVVTVVANKDKIEDTVEIVKTISKEKKKKKK